MATVKGRVEFVKKNDYGFYSIKIGEKWYSASKKNPGVSKGDLVSGSYFIKDEKWATLKGDLEVLEDSPGGDDSDDEAPTAKKSAYKKPAYSGGSNRDEYWTKKAETDAAKEPRIAYFAALERAILAAGVALENGAFNLEKAKPADRLKVIEAYIEHLVGKYTEAANNAGKPAPKAEEEESEQSEEATETEESDESWE